jgi:hypothetical protein
MLITHIQPLVALIFGILVLMVPRLLNYLVAIYLILIGAMGLWPGLFAPQTHTVAAHVLVHKG